MIHSDVMVAITTVHVYSSNVLLKTADKFSFIFIPRKYDDKNTKRTHSNHSQCRMLLKGISLKMKKNFICCMGHGTIKLILVRMSGFHLCGAQGRRV
jgi:hypothetical protein